MQLINGRPQHPQSQGLVEQAHYTLERMLSAKVSDAGVKSPPWTEWLPHIVCKLEGEKAFLQITNWFVFQILLIHKSMSQPNTLLMSWSLVSHQDQL